MLDSLTSLAGPVAYLAVAALAALEASAFVGLLVPGELALLAGGYIAHQGNARLDVMMAAAAVGAIVGDSIGYEIGRHFGAGLQRSRLGRKVGVERWARAEAYLEAKGGRAIFAGRFIGVLRALVPAVAGAAHMRYRRFLAWNALGAVIWASGMVAAGYAAGPSYRRVEHYAGRAGLVLALVAAAIAAVLLAARWIARHPEPVRRVTTKQLERPPIAALIRRHRSQLAFLGNRFRPGNALGLALTAQLACLAAAGWAFGILLQDVLGGDDAFRIDRPVVRYLADHRTGWLTTAMRDLTWLGSSLVLVPLVAIAGFAALRRTRSWAALAQLGLSLGGAVVLYSLLKPLVRRPRPQMGHLVANASGFAFPSGHATQAAAVGVTLAILVSASTGSWSRKVAAWMGAVIFAIVVGFSRVYLGVHWPTDVLAGYALGAIWASLSNLAIRWPGRVGPARQRRTPGHEAPATSAPVTPSA